AYELDLPSDTKLHRVFHSSLIEPYVENTLNGRKQCKPPPFALDDCQQPLYEVQDIIASRFFRGKHQYLVDWKGYDISDRTWEPSSSLLLSATSGLKDCI
ncbi:hypothetical protein B5P41_30645, partial [Bacillus sp. SRB_28]